MLVPDENPPRDLSRRSRASAAPEFHSRHASSAARWVFPGNNVTFDTLYGTYTPKSPHESVANLLSKHIVKADGTPGPRYFEAIQFQETNLHRRFTVDPLLLARRLPLVTLSIVSFRCGNRPAVRIASCIPLPGRRLPPDRAATLRVSRPRISDRARSSDYNGSCGLASARLPRRQPAEPTRT
jgi:hypothetical protein